MPEHPGFNLSQITGRSMVRLRVRPKEAIAAAEALQLPQQALQSRGGDPASYWLGPDQWLIASERAGPEICVVEQHDRADRRSHWRVLVPLPPEC